ncbi:CLUMA_CG014700, isoform A [Clunio marinus]|uniref:CLUMA_CG014700, isoform A n=1 Tax=Clunio marinus TaxID=568069 RepID=A0A1J1IQW5_9DIPT|nr:CLUMA_CG014700, isoform A [Clunio marinus]
MTTEILKIMSDNYLKSFLQGFHHITNNLQKIQNTHSNPKGLWLDITKEQKKSFKGKKETFELVNPRN